MSKQSKLQLLCCESIFTLPDRFILEVQETGFPGQRLLFQSGGSYFFTLGGNFANVCFLSKSIICFSSDAKKGCISADAVKVPSFSF